MKLLIKSFYIHVLTMQKYMYEHIQNMTHTVKIYFTLSLILAIGYVGFRGTPTSWSTQDRVTGPTLTSLMDPLEPAPANSQMAPRYG